MAPAATAETATALRIVSRTATPMLERSNPRLMPEAPMSLTLSDVDCDLAVESDLGINFEVITAVRSRRGRAGTHQNCRALCRAPALSTHG